MSRLDKRRQDILQPERIAIAKKKIMERGYDIISKSETELKFYYKGSMISFFPYSGWHSGAKIKDGRGLNNLLKQI